MASSAFPATPPGAAGEREMMFCHACQNEWIRDDRDSLACPSCGSGFIEIIEASNDPRTMHGIRTPSDMSTGSGLHFRHPGGSDSDPDEGDIDEHAPEGFPGFFLRRSPPDPLFAARDDHERANRTERDDIRRRFADLIMNDLGAGRLGGIPGPAMRFPPDENEHQHGPRIHQTTFSPRSRLSRPPGPQLRTVSIVSGAGANTDGPFRLFGQILGNAMMAGPDDPHRREGAGGPAGFSAFGGGLQDILASLFNPAAAVHGDAVYTQEALDRIITQLMDASPQTNAAPPASQDAIDNLEKKRVDDQMLGPEGKAECTICIDQISRGDEVAVLPCKHWYHHECVVLWLKEHNTCPICRMPIETREGNGNNNGNGQQPQQPQHHSQPSSPTNPGPTSPFAGASGASATASSPFSLFSSIPGSSRPRSDRLRSVRENRERLNSIRNAAGVGTGSGSDFRRSDLQQPSGLHRRNSLSPPSAWPSSDGASASRSARYRSPSLSRDRERDRTGDSIYPTSEWDARDYSGSAGNSSGSGRRSHAAAAAAAAATRRESQQQQEAGNGSGGNHGSGGPFSWFRDHFGRGPGSGGGGADRDRRR
ncbi:E3 ubiquitin-protein ligase RING1-like [Madurella mycetomatis]|uniref:RING-type E3 ubiquitin transferase n=1 Tax=Madurella mycetomatis TaxID=100816 RepID=A0A175WEQ8_9PEZI|nr:E3 ubiquitin-protein ligase RING1-like [Madurella mycetomatis]